MNMPGIEADYVLLNLPDLDEIYNKSHRHVYSSRRIHLAQYGNIVDLVWRTWQMMFCPKVLYFEWWEIIDTG